MTALEQINALAEFLFSHCKERDTNAAVFELNEKGAEEVMEIVFE